MSSHRSSGHNNFFHCISNVISSFSFNKVMSLSSQPIYIISIEKTVLLFHLKKHCNLACLAVILMYKLMVNSNIKLGDVDISKRHDHKNFYLQDHIRHRLKIICTDSKEFAMPQLSQLAFLLLTTSLMKSK